MIKLNLELPTFREIKTEKLEAKREKARELKRLYEAARVNRLTSDWVTQPTSGNKEIKDSLRVLRARSRQLARDDDYIKKFLSMCKSNIVGPKGIQLQVRAKDADEIDRTLEKIVEEKFTEWTHKENCAASGKLSWLDAQRLFVQTLVRDGEVLIRKVYSKTNPFGFSLKFINVDWLDETFNAILGNGNRVIMSVEVDAFDKPVAYYLTPPSSDFLYANYPTIKHRTRVPASEMIHAFLIYEDESQTRGVPWAHTAIYRLKMLGGYQEAEVVAARVEASKMNFLIPPQTEFGGDIDEERARAVYEDEVSPGQQVELPPGYDVKSFDPKHPNANQSDFVKCLLRGVAAGLDVSYFSLAQDLESVNYSSARIGLLEERDVWRALQQHAIEHFCRPVYQEWLRSAILTGAVEISMSDYDKIKEPMFRGRGWDWVDPLKDTTANIEGLNNQLTTRTEILAERGIDFEEHLETIKREEEAAARIGVSLGNQASSVDKTKMLNE